MKIEDLLQALNQHRQQFVDTAPLRAYRASFIVSFQGVETTPGGLSDCALGSGQDDAASRPSSRKKNQDTDIRRQVSMSAAYQKYRKLMTSGRFEEAARLADAEYLNGDPANPFWLTRQAGALTRAGRHEPALRLARHAIALEPANPFAVLAAAEALYGLKRIQEALEHFENIVAEPKLAAASQRGILECLLELKQWHRILESLQKWGLPSQKSHRWRVRALAGLERWDEAMAACRRWLQSQPDHPSALWALTDLEIQREGLEPVMARMAKLAKIPGRPQIYKEIYASLCRRAGKPELALAQYAKLTQGAADPKILRKQAFALSAAGKKSEAIDMLEELLKIDPGDIYAHSSYIANCRKTDQLERAAQFYANLVENNPDQKPLYGRIKQIEALQRKKNPGTTGSDK